MATITNPANIKNSLLIVSSLMARDRMVHERIATLLAAAERAQISRDRTRLTELVAHMQELPLNKREQECLGYYEAWRELTDRPDHSRARLLSLADTAPVGYRMRSLMTAGCLYAYAGDLDEALRAHSEAMKMGKQNDARILSCFLLRNQASIMGLRGDQKGALQMLERLAPLARWVSRIHPAFGLEYLNAVATEMADLGRLQEARRIISIPAASPLVSRFPEWIQSQSDIESKLVSPSRGVVTITNPPLWTVSPSEHRRGFRLVTPPATLERIKPVTQQAAVPAPRFRRAQDERLKLVANLVTVLINNGVPESVLRFMNQFIEYGPSDDLVRRITTLLERDDEEEKAESSRRGI